MNRSLYLTYWTAIALTPKLVFISLLVIFVEQSLFVPFLIFALLVGATAISIAATYKCPYCSGRALVTVTGAVPKVMESKRSVFMQFMIPEPLVKKSYYCCKCGESIGYD